MKDIVECRDVILLMMLIASRDNEGYGGILGGHSVNKAIASSNNEGNSGILGGHPVNEAIASSDNEGYSGILECHSFNEAIASTDYMESWEVILLMA